MLFIFLGGCFGVFEVGDASGGFRSQLGLMSSRCGRSVFGLSTHHRWVRLSDDLVV